MTKVILQENTVKYLAGLLDADGALSFRFNECVGGYRLHLILHFSAAESIDKDGKFCKGLPELTGAGMVRSRQREHWAPINEWQVQSERDLNVLLPRITKHMVIKGRHWQNLFAVFSNTRGKILTETDMLSLKQFSKESRKDAGPIKAKKHPTWAWVCGYLEGDGCFTFKKHPSGYGMKLSVTAIAHRDDSVGLELLHKAFGGVIYTERKDNCHEWKRNLGKTDWSFTTKFLPKLIQHSRLKKHKMEQMMAYIHSHTDSQRLTEDKPTG